MWGFQIVRGGWLWAMESGFLAVATCHYDKSVVLKKLMSVCPVSYCWRLYNLNIRS